MADIYKGELQDNLGNTVYPHTESDVVFCTDGETVQEKFTSYDNVLGGATGKSGSLEVGDANILATTEATKKLSDSLGGLEFAVVDGKPQWKERGADTFNPFSGGGKLMLVSTTNNFNIADIVGAENVGEYSVNDFVCVPNLYSSIGTYSFVQGGIDGASNLSIAHGFSKPILTYDNTNGDVMITDMTLTETYSWYYYNNPKSSKKTYTIPLDVYLCVRTGDSL